MPMPSTHVSLHYHIVFSTKDRLPIIDPEWRPRLHAILGGAVRNIGGVALEVGGVADHVHLLAGLKATHCVADVLRDLKKGSSAWVHDVVGERRFYWQEGYGAFTVSRSGHAAVARYIRGQEEHHRARSFKEEYLRFLEANGVAFDDRYLW
jgi:REP element-mobilizing transposase RayT